MTRRDFTFAAGLGSLASFAVLTTGCGSAQWVMNLQKVVDAVDKTLPALAGTVMPPNTAAQIGSYLTAVEQLVAGVPAILGGSNAITTDKINQIIQLAANISVPVLAGVAPQVGVMVSVVTVALNVFLSQFGAAAKPAGAPAMRPHVVLPRVIAVSGKDKSKLEQMAARAGRQVIETQAWLLNATAAPFEAH